jgi:hypothetical protein
VRLFKTGKMCPVVIGVDGLVREILHIIFSMTGKSVITNTLHEIYCRQHARIGVHHDGDIINKKLYNTTYDP